jgi:hypothetical protein
MEYSGQPIIVEVKSGPDLITICINIERATEQDSERECKITGGVTKRLNNRNKDCEVHIHVDQERPLMGRRARPDETGGWAKGMYLKGREKEEKDA